MALSVARGFWTAASICVSEIPESERRVICLGMTWWIHVCFFHLLLSAMLSFSFFQRDGYWHQEDRFLREERHFSIYRIGCNDVFSSLVYSWTLKSSPSVCGVKKNEFCKTHRVQLLPLIFTRSSAAVEWYSARHVLCFLPRLECRLKGMHTSLWLASRWSGFAWPGQTWHSEHTVSKIQSSRERPG